MDGVFGRRYWRAGAVSRLINAPYGCRLSTVPSVTRPTSTLEIFSLRSFVCFLAENFAGGEDQAVFFLCRGQKPVPECLCLSIHSDLPRSSGRVWSRDEAVDSFDVSDNTGVYDSFDFFASSTVSLLLNCASFPMRGYRLPLRGGREECCHGRRLCGSRLR